MGSLMLDVADLYKKHGHSVVHSVRLGVTFSMTLCGDLAKQAAAVGCVEASNTQVQLTAKAAECCYGQLDACRVALVVVACMGGLVLFAHAWDSATVLGPVVVASCGSMHGLLSAIVWVGAKGHPLRWVVTLGLQSFTRGVLVTAELRRSGTFDNALVRKFLPVEAVWCVQGGDTSGGGSWVQLQLHGLGPCGWPRYGGLRTVKKRARGVFKHTERCWVVSGLL